MHPDDLAATVALLADRVAIGELTARYNRTFDDGDLPAFVATFTADAVIEEVGGKVFAGSEAIGSFMGDEHDGSTVHATTDALIVIDGDTARQDCSLILSLRRADRAKVMLFATGRYADELVRTPEGWRFSRRVITLDLDRPNPA